MTSAHEKSRFSIATIGSIEKEPGARSEMLEKARAQGVSTQGIPVIDVRGTLLGGFDANAVERLLASK